MEKILLFDGNAFMHRAFHAIPADLKTKDGIYTNAVYGFFLMILNIMKEIDPSHCVFTFDSPKKTFRHEIFQEYKATRNKAPQELYDQMPIIRDGLRLCNAISLDLPGFEADDLLGSLSKKYSHDDMKVVISTGDLDTLQLVNSNVTIACPSRGPERIRYYNTAGVIERLGVKPEQVIDFKALCGDKSDNIPGVAGVGPVQAVKLLDQYLTLENIYENIDQISGATKKKLMENKETAYLSQQLATIDTNLDLEIDIETTAISKWYLPDLYEFFKKYECYNLLNKAKFLEKKALAIHKGQTTLF